MSDTIPAGVLDRVTKLAQDLAKDAGCSLSEAVDALKEALGGERPPIKEVSTDVEAADE